MPADDIHAKVRSELARGEYLSAYDLASEAEREFPDDLRLRYAALLALARSGAIERAAELLERSGLLAVTTRDASVDLVEDVGALRARLAKDQSLRATGTERLRLAGEAAARYEAVYRAFGRYYPCVNAATMYLVAGNEARADELATEALRLTDVAGPDATDDDYWCAASAAEAALVLGDTARARTALERAAQCRPIDLSARAATRRQLRLVCDAKDIDVSVLDALAPPGVVHYCGHRIGPAHDSARFPVADEPRVAAEIARELENASAGFGYGSLASGADIIVAEALLERGAELHLFLPFAREEFVALSVRPAGEAWVDRFDRCMTAATSITQTAVDLVGSPEVLFDYCARVAMGHALIRAAFLDSTARQVAVYDGEPTVYAAGTSVDVERWRAGGHASAVVAPRAGGARPAGAAAEPAPAPGDSDPDADAPSRRLVAMLFADFKGFSKLDDRELLAFHRAVLTRVAKTLADYQHTILHTNTWGDGLHVVFGDATSAAECALDLQETVGAIDPAETGLPTSPLLRIGMHVGPVLSLHDPILDAPGFLGTHITRTARIEPRTPEGSVYVTNQFAAILALEEGSTLGCDYVGHIPTAKDYGTLPMYVLHRRASGARSSHR